MHSLSNLQLFTSAAGIANNADGSNKIRSAPYNFPYAGFAFKSTLSFADSRGYYWSRTANSSTAAYNLYFIGSDVSSAYTLGRCNGFSIRCVATT